jgi:VWFA-related protein
MRFSLHRHKRPVLMGFGVLLSLFPLAKTADTPDPMYRSDVEEVRLTFYATDQRNASVDAIAKSDFAVVDSDRVLHNFRSFGRSPETKLDLVVLIDCSESVLPRFQQEISDVLQLIGQSRWIADDKISLISFRDSTPVMICSGDCRDSPLESRLATLNAGGQTPLYDAVELAGKFLQRRHDPEVRPIILVFSDGQDTISRSSAMDALASVLNSDAQIYSVDMDSSHLSKGTSVLRAFSAATGGRYLRVQDGGAKMLGGLLDDLHSAYLLTYALPSQTAGFHPVRILPTHNLDLRFRCRRGYFYDGGDR